MLWGLGEILAVGCTYGQRNDRVHHPVSNFILLDFDVLPLSDSEHERVVAFPPLQIEPPACGARRLPHEQAESQERWHDPTRSRTLRLARHEPERRSLDRLLIEQGDDNPNPLPPVLFRRFAGRNTG